MPIKSKTFWTDQTEKDIILWLKTKDDIFYLSNVQPPLLALSLWTIQRYSGNVERWYMGSMDNMKYELVSHTSISLERYDKLKGTLYSFCMGVMRRHLQRSYAISLVPQRNFKSNTYIGKDSIMDLLELGSFDGYNSNYDPLLDTTFIQYFCSWWKINVKQYFKLDKIPLFIIDCIENPMNHKTNDTSYAPYICKKLKITKQSVSLYLIKMKSISKCIFDEYENNKKK